MSDYRVLIDTHIIIGLEDNRPVQALFAEFQRLCIEHGVGIFVDQANYDDIARDKDQVRRTLTLSKLDKFPRLARIELPAPNLEELFGPLSSANDFCDARLLLALRQKAVDFLITEDARLRRRAERAGIGDRVMTILEAVDWLQKTFTKAKIELPFIVSRKAYEIDTSDHFFNSLRADYPEFDVWFDEKCRKKHRDCWVLEIERRVAGLLIRKDENRKESGVVLPGDKVLKICTFKVGDLYRGEKFGELLLKQCLWFAARNSYDVLYTTVFPRHDYLVDLLARYGFQETERLPNGEIRVERAMIPPSTEAGLCPIDYARKWYPRFRDDTAVRKFCIPIQAPYHSRLFPEIAFLAELPLFPETHFGRTLMGFQGKERTPGNTIRKVYLCRAQNRRMRPGDLVFFYVSKQRSYRASQAITTIGVIDQISVATSTEDLIRMTAKRSVYDHLDLYDWAAAPDHVVRVIDFLLMEHLDLPVPLRVLIEHNIFKGQPPQSIVELTHGSYQTLITLSSRA